MTSADLNDLVPAQQEKLEWVTPKISLLEAGDTRSSKSVTGTYEAISVAGVKRGPS